MTKLRQFFLTTILGGVTVILPMVILVLVFNWLFELVDGTIAPFTKLIVNNSGIRLFIARIIVVSIILFVCFAIGLIIRTKFGQFIHNFIEDRVFKIAPGYNLIKETVLQLLGSKKSPFSTVALARLFNNETLVTCFVTDEHEDGMVSVFVPTGPNPTSGLIYHLNKKDVFPVDISIESAMRTIISCGSGSSELFSRQKKISKN